MDDIQKKMKATMADIEKINLNNFSCFSNIMVLDVEAALTGELIQIAYNIYDSKFKTLVKRNFLINENINKVDFFNKFTLEQIHNYGMEPTKVLNLLKKDFLKCGYIVCHNISYDCSKLTKYFNKYNIKYTFPNHICTMKTTRDVIGLKNKLGNNKMPKLSELYYYCFNKEVDEDLCHSADFDIKITFDCLKKLIKLKIITL